MNEKLEEKIRKEIHKRIREEEEFLTEKEQQDENITYIEILDISTLLPREDVARIAKNVRDGFEKKHGIRKWLCFFSLLCVIGVILFFSLQWFMKQRVSRKKGNISTSSQQQIPDSDKTSITPVSGSFEESFDNDKFGWFVGEEFVYKGAIQDRSYVFEGGEEFRCYGDRIPLKFPTQFIVELTSTWKSGEYDLYGFSLSQEDGKGHVFPLKGDGTASYAKLSEGKPEFEESWLSNKAHIGDGKIANVQRLEIVNDTFKYFINNKLFKKGSAGGLRFSDILIHSCGKQKVAFNYLKIMTLDKSGSGKVILDEHFDNANAGWSPEIIFSKRCFFENGKYIFSTNKESACNWSSIPVELGKDCNIRLDSIWKNGERGPYGLMLMQDDENYFAYQLKNDDIGRFINVSEGEVKHKSNWGEIGKPGEEGKNTQYIVIKGNKFQYNVNDKAIETGEIPENFKINKLSLEVCGKQSIAFEHLSVQE